MRFFFIKPDEANTWYAIWIEEPNAEKTARMPTKIAL